MLLAFMTQACLVQGKLPGQESNFAKFAKAPKSLLMEELWDPPDYCEHMDCISYFSVSDVL